MAMILREFDPTECLKAVAAVEADLNCLVSSLNEIQFHAPPRTGGWSIAYCIEHLALSGQAFLSRWDWALKEVTAKQYHSDGPFSYNWWQRRLLRIAEPPYKLKTKTREPFVPCSRRPMPDTISRFLSIHQEFARRVASSPGLDVGRVKIQSPFASSISYPLGFSFDLALAHERRHLWQAWQVRQQLIQQ
jgi:hypothetical protein